MSLAYSTENCAIEAFPKSRLWMMYERNSDCKWTVVYNMQNVIKTSERRVDYYNFMKFRKLSKETTREEFLSTYC